MKGNTASLAKKETPASWGGTLDFYRRAAVENRYLKEFFTNHSRFKLCHLIRIVVILRRCMSFDNLIKEFNQNEE